MSLYTTEVRYICEEAAGRTESAGFDDMENIISLSRTHIFNFPYPIFDENYRPVLESKILRHFYTREICCETVGLWKYYLSRKLNEIMPYYNQLYKSELLEFNPLYQVDVTTTHDKAYHEDNRGNTDVSGGGTNNASSTGKSHGHRMSDGEQQNLFSDTPEGDLDGLNNRDYLTNATVQHGSDVSHNDSVSSASSSGGNTYNEERESKNNKSGLENYFERVKGINGKSSSSLLKEFRETFLNIDAMILEELKPLFFMLWR